MFICSFAPLASLVVSLRLLTADGTAHDCSPTSNPDLFHAALTSCGALGIISTLTFKVRCILLLNVFLCPLWTCLLFIILWSVFHSDWSHFYLWTYPSCFYSARNCICCVPMKPSSMKILSKSQVLCERFPLRLSIAKSGSFRTRARVRFCLHPSVRVCLFMSLCVWGLALFQCHRCISSCVATNFKLLICKKKYI